MSSDDTDTDTDTTDDSTPPVDPVGHAGLQAAGATGVIATDVLWLLQTYVWHGRVPPEITATVYLVVPYVAAIIAGRMARRRRLTACQRPPAAPPDVPPAPPVPEPPQGP